MVDADTEITHIIFDIDGTLIDESSRLDGQASAVAWKFGDSLEEKQKVIDAFFAANDRVVQEGGGEKNNISRYMEWISESLGTAVSSEEAEQLAREWSAAYEASHDDPMLFDDVIPTLQALREKEVELLIASGGGQEKKEKLLKDAGISEYFSNIFCANDVGFQKQDVRFWESVLKEIGVSPERIAVVGNQINDDIMHPQVLGIKTIFIKRPDTLVKNLGPKDVLPDHTTTSLQKISELIQ